MKAAGYNQVAYMFKQNGSSLDSKSTKDLKNLIEEYRLSQMDLLDDFTKKEVMLEIKKITEELKEINKNLTKSTKKYDYSKLPKDNP